MERGKGGGKEGGKEGGEGEGGWTPNRGQIIDDLLY